MLRRTSMLRFNRASEELKSQFSSALAKTQKQAQWLKKNKANEVLSPSTIGTSYGGMRGVTSLIYEPSLLDPIEGIRFRGLSIPECQKKLPSWKSGEEMIPEGMLWLLLTGNVPTKAQAEDLAKELNFRANNNKALNEEVVKAINGLPKDLHPMSQFAIASLTLQKDSLFAKKYAQGMKKTEYWEPALEDTLNLIARITYPTALIYRRAFKDGVVQSQWDENLDWSGNFCKMLGFTDAKFHELMRLYLSIHTDHEGGNVSAHSTILIGSALSDPYTSFAGGMCGLAGPLHGLANQEVLSWLKGLTQRLADKGVELSAPDDVLKKTITEVTWETLNAGQVVPGYGHAVLRKTDPRYTCQREFALKNLPKDNLFRLVSNVYEVMPEILTQHGKTKNPFPNVDAHSGCLLQYYGMKEENFYTVLFGMSRALGVLTAFTWDRAMNKPIERPKSMTTESLAKKYGYVFTE